MVDREESSRYCETKLDQVTKLCNDRDKTKQRTNERTEERQADRKA